MEIPNCFKCGDYCENCSIMSTINESKCEEPRKCNNTPVTYHFGYEHEPVFYCAEHIPEWLKRVRETLESK